MSQRRFDARQALTSVDRPRSSALPQISLFIAALGVGAFGAWGLQVSGLADRLLEAELTLPGTVASSVAQQHFPLCAGLHRDTCVVDGDTFWLDGVKFRIADIDTPEVGTPHCDAEARQGAMATQRLRELLSAGPFDLAQVERDQDRYGRKLRTVMRDGQSLGMVLVGEGLAHEWLGSKQSWC